MCEKNKLGQAKKRNTKVEITDIAIEKVPYVHYRGLTEEQNKMMYSLAKLVMRLAKDRNHSNEVAITWNIASNNPNVYGVAYGSEYAVDVSADTLSYHLLISSSEATVVMLHNHPSTRTFSLEDILFLLQFPKLCYFVVVTNQGTLHYLKKEKNYNVKKAGLLYNECVSSMKNAKTAEQLYRGSIAFLHRCGEVGLYYE